jgi:DNA-binding CsgD family transcriptional regulator
MEESRKMAYGRPLRTIAELERGDHACCLYETEEERRAVLMPFLRQGLERGEKVLYIVDAHTPEAVLTHLRDEGLDVEPFLAHGQLAIVSRDETYMQQGVFDPDAMIALLRADTDQALVDGYQALRVTGEMSWALRGLPGSERLIEYETRVNDVFRGGSCLAICQYDRRAFSAALLLDVLCTHAIAVVGAEVYDNFYYLSPANLLGHEAAEARLRNWVDQLTQHKRAEKALREAKEELRSTVERRAEGAKRYRLTVRELTVLRLVAAGESDRDIATVLGISPLTAHKHLANIRKKMGAVSRTEAGVRALREGLLD